MNKRKIKYVDGYKIRNIFPDFDLVESYSTASGPAGLPPTPVIPKGEIWIDKNFRREAKLLLEAHRLTQLKYNWREKRIRAYIQAKLTKKGVPPRLWCRREKQGKITIVYVRGELIRKYIDPWFTLGGHDLVYPYVPANEIWIDIRQDKKEIPYTLSHELFERKLMSQGWSYPEAHAFAIKKEKKERRKELKADPAKPIKMIPFKQGPASCGPASLRILLAYFGLEYEEKYLSKLCGTTHLGTEHEGMIKAAETLGAKVKAKRGSIKEIRRLVMEERIPVIVGWWSDNDKGEPEKVTPENDEGHFSVIYHFDKRFIYMMDPETKTGRRKISIKRFLEKWWDADGADYKKIRRWYMFIQFP